MELALLVYVVDLLINIDTFFNGLTGFMVFLAIAGGFFTAMYLSGDDGGFADWRRIWYTYWAWPKIMIMSLIITWLIPDEKTIQYIAGAYIIQETYQSEFVQQAGTLAGKAVLNQLAVWAKDNGDVEKLLKQLEQQGVKVPVVTVEEKK
jgi:hypothetical protein